LDADSGARAADHFQKLGLQTRLLSSPEATEIAKLSETTYFGVLIAWAQEVERYCHTVGANYDEVVSFYEEIKFFPPIKYVPGIIGGHCVMPNIDILFRQFPSPLLKAIVQSNSLKKGDLPEKSWLTSNKAPDEA
jgi:UDP-N-acetyl-D-mannosaminuronate dehydrogenase